MPLEYNSRFRAALIAPASEEDAAIADTLAAFPAGLFELVVVATHGAASDAAHRAGACVVEQAEPGYSIACRSAIEALPSNLDAIVFLPADLANAAEEAELLLAPLREGRADAVIGSDTTCAIRGDALRGLGMREPGGSWTLEMRIRARRNGLRVLDLRRARPVWKFLPTAIRLWFAR